MDTEIRVKLAGDLSLPHLPIWVGHFREAVAAQHAGGTFTLTVDLSETTFVSASSAASLASLLTWFRAGNCVHGRFLRPRNRDVDHWLSRMDFYEVVGATVRYPFHRWPDGGRLQEVTQLTNEPQVDVVTQRIAEILSSKTELDQDVVKNLQTLTAELIENVFHHAQSSVGAFVCAQCYPQRRIVEVGIADCGRGISASLKGNPELLDRFSTETDAIRLALLPRITGRPSVNSGWGLSWASEFARANEGHMSVLSGEAMLRVEPSGDTCVNAPRWPGTVVGFQVHMDRPVDLGMIMRKLDAGSFEFDDLFGE